MCEQSTETLEEIIVSMDDIIKAIERSPEVHNDVRTRAASLRRGAVSPLVAIKPTKVQLVYSKVLAINNKEE